MKNVGNIFVLIGTSAMVSTTYAQNLNTQLRSINNQIKVIQTDTGSIRTLEEKVRTACSSLDGIVRSYNAVVGADDCENAIGNRDAILIEINGVPGGNGGLVKEESDQYQVVTNLKALDRTNAQINLLVRNRKTASELNGLITQIKTAIRNKNVEVGQAKVACTATNKTLTNYFTKSSPCRDPITGTWLNIAIPLRGDAFATSCMVAKTTYEGYVTAVNNACLTYTLKEDGSIDRPLGTWAIKADELSRLNLQLADYNTQLANIGSAEGYRGELERQRTEARNALPGELTKLQSIRDRLGVKAGAKFTPATSARERLRLVNVEIKDLETAGKCEGLAEMPAECLVPNQTGPQLAP